MAFERYAANTKALRGKLGLATFDESDLAIRGVLFQPGQGDEFRVSSRDMDLGTRIFFQYYGTRDGVRATGLFCADLLHPDRAPAFFAELWLDALDVDTHPAVWALKDAQELNFGEVVLIWSH